MKKTHERLARIAAIVCLATALGCAREAWNLDRYRDERARDIDTRLSDGEPIVKNPFGQDGAVR